MKVKAKKTIYYHNKDGKLVKLVRGQIADVPKAIVDSNPYAFEEPDKKEPSKKE